MNVTDDDVDHEGGGLSCTGGTWPYTTSDIDAVYDTTTASGAVPVYDQGVWALNSPSDLYSTLHDDYLANLYIADVNGNDNEIHTYSDAECNWYSWAGLNDVITAKNPDNPMYTGIFLGLGDDDGHDDWACTYEPWVTRARQEATQHPDIVKVVELDELYRVMDGPDTTLWQGWGTQDDGSFAPSAHWRRENVEALHDMVAKGQYGGTSWDFDANSLQSTDCTGLGTTTTLSGSDLELWARVIAPAVPRYIVPSSVLGVPADPAYVEAHHTGSTTTYDDDYGFWDGDQLSATWTVMAPDAVVLSGHTHYTANLEFFYVVATPDFGDVEISAAVNSTTTPNVTVDLSTDPPVENFWHTDGCIGGPNCITSSAWDFSSHAINTLTISLDSHVIMGSGAQHPETILDRLVYLWGIRYYYVDTDTGGHFFDSDYLLPGVASYTATNMPTTTAAVTQDNSDWRVTDYLEGITVPSTDFSADFDGDTWDDFVELTCDYLYDFEAPKRCLVDERGWWDQTSAYNNADLDIMSTRLLSGDAYGDGVISTWLSTAIDNAGVDGGRFTDRDPLGNDSPYDYDSDTKPWQVMLYEPRQSRATPGETHTYTSDPISSGCTGDYVIEWNNMSDDNSPLYQWLVEWYDASAGTWNTKVDGQTTECMISTEDSCADDDDRRDEGWLYDPDFPKSIHAEAGDLFKISWVDVERGGGPDVADYVDFRVIPPSSACARTWTHGSSMESTFKYWNDVAWVNVSMNPSPQVVYDCITDFFLHGSTPGWTCP